MTAKDSLYNEIISLVDSHNVKSTNTNVETLKSLCSHLIELLWHITSHHTYFEERGAKVPGIFQIFANLDDYKNKKKAKPRLSSEKLKHLANMISNHSTQPWLCKDEY